MSVARYGLLAAGALTMSALAHVLSADGSTAAGVPAEAILLKECRVSLIDELTLSSERAGVLDFVVAEGTAVRKGEVIAHTRDDVARATVAIVEEQAASDVEIRFARKALELAQLEYERDLTANQINPDTIPDAVVREHRLAAEKALLQLEQAEQSRHIEELRLRESREVLKLHSVHAPFDAVVRLVHRRAGESVGEGDAILDLVNTDRVRVEGEVELADLPRVKPGAAVQVWIDVPGVDLPSERQPFAGKVAFVDVKVDPVYRRVKVWAEVDARSGMLKDGMPAVMRIATETDVAATNATSAQR